VQTQCTGNASQACGATKRIWVYTATCTRNPPSFQACLDEESKKLPFCNSSLSLDERVEDLLERLTLEEKISMIAPQSSLGSTCEAHTAGVSRLGIPQWTWLVETNTGVAADCLAQGKCSTTFNGPEGLGASFNRTVWKQKGYVFGNEMRAYNNLGWHRVGYGLIGLTAYGPNINIVRDPRFGRNSELPGEDPYLSGAYATEMINAMQVRCRLLFMLLNTNKKKKTTTKPHPQFFFLSYFCPQHYICRSLIRMGIQKRKRF
jgi:hypothetical protein